MNDQHALGQMANAPLALVLAQVRFSPYLTIGNCIPAIQDALRKTYPVFRKGQMQTIEFGPASPSPTISTSDRWDFVDAGNREGFIVQQNSLVFLATRYKTFEDFAHKHDVVLECIERTVPDIFVERIGLRYVDLIVPTNNHTPEDYVFEGLRGCPLEIESPKSYQARHIARWRVTNGVIVFRYISGVQSPYLPPDLQMIELSPPEIIERAKRSSSQVGMMDFDRTMDCRGPYRAQQISQLFVEMHNDASKAFKRAMSTLAEVEWNSKTAS